MKKIILFAVSAYILTSILFSCTKAKPPVIVVSQRSICFVTKQSAGGETLYEFLYDSTNVLKRVNEYSKSALLKYSVFEYNTLRNLSVIRNYDWNNKSINYITYDYFPTNYIKSASLYVKIGNGNLVKTKRNDYQYTISGQVIKESYYNVIVDSLNQSSSSAKLSKIISYSYDGLGNATTITTSDVNEQVDYYGHTAVIEVVNQIASLEYDSKHNLYKELPFITDDDPTNGYPFGLRYNLSSGNITKAIYNNIRGDILSNSFTTSYEYNTQGYPIKETIYPIGGGNYIVYTFEYKCKDGTTSAQ